MNVSSARRAIFSAWALFVLFSCSSPAETEDPDAGEGDIVDERDTDSIADAFEVTRITTASAVMLLDYEGRSGEAFVMQRRDDDRLELMYSDGVLGRTVMVAEERAFDQTWHGAAPGWRHLLYSHHGPDAELRPELWRWSVEDGQAMELGKEVDVTNVWVSEDGEWATFRRAIDGWGIYAGGDLVSVRLGDGHTVVMAGDVLAEDALTNESHTRIVAVGVTDTDRAALIALRVGDDAPIHIADEVYSGTIRMVRDKVYYTRQDALYVWDFETEAGEVVFAASPAEPLAFSDAGRWLAHMSNAANDDGVADLVVHDLETGAEYVLLTQVHVEFLDILGQGVVRAVVSDGERRDLYLWSPSSFATGEPDFLDRDTLEDDCLPLFSATGERMIYGADRAPSGDVRLMAWQKDQGSREVGLSSLRPNNCSGLMADSTLERVILRASTGEVSVWNGESATALVEASEFWSFAASQTRSRVYFRTSMESLSSPLHMWDFALAAVSEVENGEYVSQIVRSSTDDSMAFLSLLPSTQAGDDCGGYSCDQRLYLIPSSQPTQPLQVALDADRILALGDGYVFFVTEEPDGHSLYFARQN